MESLPNARQQSQSPRETIQDYGHLASVGLASESNSDIVILGRKHRYPHAESILQFHGLLLHGHNFPRDLLLIHLC